MTGQAGPISRSGREEVLEDDGDGDRLMGPINVTLEIDAQLAIWVHGTGRA